MVIEVVYTFITANLHTKVVLQLILYFIDKKCYFGLKVKTNYIIGYNSNVLCPFEFFLS